MNASNHSTALSLNLPKAAQVVILISGRGSNMMALIEAIERDGLPVSVAAVISNRPDAAGLAWAAARGIPVQTVDHRQFPDRASFDQALGDAIDAAAQASSTDAVVTEGSPDAWGVGRATHAPALAATTAAHDAPVASGAAHDATVARGAAPATRPWVLLAGFMRVLTAGFVERYRERLINIHPALLPAHPGLHTHRQALDAGAMLHGATVHFVTPEVDVGPIIAQAVVPVLAGDTEDALGARVLTMEHRLFPMVLDWLACGRLTLSDDGRVLLDGEDHPQSRMLLHPLLASADSGHG